MEIKENKIKSNNIVIILLVVVILMLFGYIAYDKGIIFSNNEEKSEKSNTQYIQEKTNDDNEINNNKEEVIEDLNLSKCLSGNNITYSNASDKEGDYGLSMTINPDGISATLSIDWNKFGPLSNASSWGSTVEKYQITGFSQNIMGTFIGDLGQDSTGITLFFLMNDGTVEYTPLFNMKYDSQNNSYYEMNYTNDSTTNTQKFVTKGTIDNVNNIIKLYTVDASNGSGWKTTIAAKADGSFYDLGNIILK